MKIVVLSRARVETLLKEPDHGLESFNFISIINSDAPLVKGFPVTAKVLRMRFDDLNEEDWDTPELKEEIRREGKIIFDEDMAREIIQFVEDMDKTKDLIVHCHAGICRSGAVGDFIRRKLGLNFDDFIRTNPQIIPNTHVLSTLMEVQDTIDFWDNQRNRISDGSDKKV